MNRSAAAIGIGVLAIAVIVGVILFMQLPSPDTPAGPPQPAAEGAAPAQVPVSATAGEATGSGAAISSVPATPAGGSTPPSFDVVRVDRRGNVVIAGKADPDCVVTVRNGDTVVGTATADRRGDWVIVPAEPLASGESQLSLSAKCGDAPAVEAEKVVVLIVPERDIVTAGASTPAGAPHVSQAAAPPADAANAIAVAIPRDSSKPGEIMQSPAAPADGVTIDSVDYGDKGQVVISGRAAPGGGVQIYLDNRLIGRAQANAAGRWTLVPDMAIAPGQYALRADLLRPDGTVVARSEIPFVRGEPLADLPAGRIVVIQPGDYLWKIARASYGAGTRYTLIYDANRAQISNPDLIYPGQVFTLPHVN